MIRQTKPFWFKGTQEDWEGLSQNEQQALRAKHQRPKGVVVTPSTRPEDMTGSLWDEAQRILRAKAEREGAKPVPLTISERHSKLVKYVNQLVEHVNRLEKRIEALENTTCD
jgi:hypothetical protein